MYDTTEEAKRKRDGTKNVQGRVNKIEAEVGLGVRKVNISYLSSMSDVPLSLPSFLECWGKWISILFLSFYHYHTLFISFSNFLFLQCPTNLSQKSPLPPQTWLLLFQITSLQTRTLWSQSQRGQRGLEQSPLVKTLTKMKMNHIFSLCPPKSRNQSKVGQQTVQPHKNSLKR